MKQDSAIHRDLNSYDFRLASAGDSLHSRFQKRELAVQLSVKIAGLLAIAFTTTIAAATVNAIDVDQKYSATPVQIAYPVSRSVTLGQTFTVGLTGKLNRIELQIGKSPNSSLRTPLTIDIVETFLDGSPNTEASGLLASLELDENRVSDVPLNQLYTNISLGTQSFAVTKGQELAIVLSSFVGPDRYFWLSRVNQLGNEYSGGKAYYFHHRFHDGLQPRPNEDRGFRTFVAVIPEPASVQLIFVSASCLLLRRRMRTQRQMMLTYPSWLHHPK